MRITNLLKRSIFCLVVLALTGLALTPPAMFRIPASTSTVPLKVFDPVKVEDGGSYSVIIANPAGAFTSDDAALTVIVPQVPPGDNFSDRVAITGTSGFATGTNFDTTFQINKFSTNSSFYFLNPYFRSNLQFKFTQPLLRNFKIDGVRESVLTAKKQRDNSDVTLHATIVQTSRNVKNAYWDLVYQIDNLKAAQQSLQLAQQSIRLVAEFAGFSRNVDLQQKRHPLRRLLGAFVDFLREMQTVHALDHVEQLKCVPAFVRLQMTDHVPPQVAGAERNFRLRLLHFAFPKQIQPECGDGANGVGRLAFADREQSDGGRVSIGAGAGSLDPLLNGG